MIGNEDYAYWGKLGVGGGGEKFTKDSYIARYRPHNYKIVDTIVECCGKPKKVLSLGCGLGFDIERLLTIGVYAVGVEVAKHMINSSPMKDKIFSGSASDLSQFSDSEFDLVLALELLEHIPPELTEKTVSEIRRVGNNIAVLTIGRGKADPTHINIRSRNEWEKILVPIDYKLQKCVSNGLKDKRLVDMVWDRVYVMELK